MPDIAFGEVAPSVLFIIPAGWRINGDQVVTNSGQSLPLFPTLPTQYAEWPTPGPNGERRFLFTDQTFRDARGNVLQDLFGTEAPLQIGGGKRSTDVLRQNGPGSGAPLVMGAQNVNLAAGVPDRLDQSVTSLGYDIFDPRNSGGRLYAVRPEPAYNGDLQNIPADWPWLWSDGTIRLLSGGPIIAGTPGPLPTQVIEAPYVPPPVNNGTRDNAWGTPPVLAGAVAPAYDPTTGDDGTRAPILGVSAPVTTAPTTPLPSGAVATTATGAIPGGGAANFLTAPVLGVPLWGWLAAAAVILARKKG
jgi:hypothetical protein